MNQNKVIQARFSTSFEADLLLIAAECSRLRSPMEICLLGAKAGCPTSSPCQQQFKQQAEEAEPRGPFPRAERQPGRGEQSGLTQEKRVTTPERLLFRSRHRRQPALLGSNLLLLASLC